MGSAVSSVDSSGSGRLLEKVDSRGEEEETESLRSEEQSDARERKTNEGGFPPPQEGYQFPSSKAGTPVEKEAPSPAATYA